MRATWKCGYAEGDITPKPGQAFMTGFGRERYARGRISPLIAQAIALEDANGKRSVFVAADLLGYSRVFVDAVRARLASAYGLAADEVALPCSHTHCGPTVNFGLTFAVGGQNVWYLAHLEDRIEALVGEALKTMSPARISYGGADCQIGMNRRLIEDGKVLHEPSPQGIYDRHTPILQIGRRRSPREVILVSHACHPTSSGALDKWSPDWPGAMRRRIESHRDDCKAVFAKGCGADANVVHKDPQSGSYVFSRDPKRSRLAGYKLANQVLAFLDASELMPLDPILSTSIASGKLSLKRRRTEKAIRELALKGDNHSHLTWWARQSLAYPDNRTDVDYDAQVWGLGGLKMFWLEGEVCADLGIAIREMVAGPVATIAYTNACQGYISSRRLIREGGYEGDTSHMAYFLPAPFSERSEKEFMQICRKALRRLDG